MVFVNWIKPEPGETMAHYAGRLKSQITTANPILIGVSFGSMIAVEIAKILNPVCTIIISSTLFSDDLPFLYRLAGKLKFIKIAPSWLIKSSNQLTQNFFFGTKSNSEKKLLSMIIRDTDINFLKWALGSILSWRNDEIPKRLSYTWHER